MPNMSTNFVKAYERFVLVAKVLFDGLDRVGVTILALSIIGGLLAPKTSAMTTDSAFTGAFIGFALMMVGGYAKDRADATLKTIREVLRAEDETGEQP
ncbi:hypothetical protein R0J87_15745 [Halomonas sp. SIMBA_159]